MKIFSPSLHNAHRRELAFYSMLLREGEAHNLPLSMSILEGGGNFPSLNVHWKLTELYR